MPSIAFGWFLIKNTHTSERNIDKIDKRKNVQNIFIDTLSFFTHLSSQDQKQIFYQ